MVNFVSNSPVVGGVVIGAGVLAALFVFVLGKKMKTLTLSTVITQVQLLIIIAASATKGELHVMFPLMLASMAMGGVYLNPKSLYIHWGIMDEEIKLVTRENQNSINEAEKASESAGKSKTLLGESQAEMRNMIDAMREIETTSAKIQGIVKAIEDIAFQTNILALNASVEAARAGDMGKGFAVVADEVRNLANKSAEAVQNTTELIDESLVAVNRGKEIADGVANKMNEVITTANKSAEYANNITGLTKQQAVSINTVKSYIDNISQVISHNTDTATESMRVAQAVASDAGKMDEIVSEYR